MCRLTPDLNLYRLLIFMSSVEVDMKCFLSSFDLFSFFISGDKLDLARVVWPLVCALRQYAYYG